jgi:hypothetical protein
MGDRAGLGGENGHSHGRAVTFSERRSGRHVGLASVSFLLSIGSFTISSCSRPSAPATPDAKARLRGIAIADPAKYASLKESKHWSNPYLVVRADKIGLLTGVAANEEQMLQPDEVLNALADLPTSAWPYGRAVAVLVDKKAAGSEQDKISLRRNRGIVDGELRGAQIAIYSIPTS